MSACFPKKKKKEEKVTYLMPSFLPSLARPDNPGFGLGATTRARLLEKAGPLLLAFLGAGRAEEEEEAGNAGGGGAWLDHRSGFSCRNVPI